MLILDKIEIDKAIETFMHPVVYTGVKPILLVAEELVTENQVGNIVEAVWIGLNSNEEFSYISKFAVTGKVFLTKYYTQDEMQAFSGRLALPHNKNLQNVVIHKAMVQEIKELKAKRGALLHDITRGFGDIADIHLNNEELYIFEKKNGDWQKELFSDFDINIPYKVVNIVEKPSGVQLQLENSRTDKTLEYSSSDNFYGYFVGSLAEIAGLKMKSQSYLKSIESLEHDAKMTMKKIEWLELEHPAIQNISKELSKYPFEEDFNYVKKENIRKVSVAEELVDTLKDIILKYMPENNTPLGMEYIPIDKLLFLFHAIIPREEALAALESCDIVYQPPAMVLGHQGKHQLPPKFLVPISHVASAYQRFEFFMDTCKHFKN